MLISFTFFVHRQQIQNESLMAFYRWKKNNSLVYTHIPGCMLGFLQQNSCLLLPQPIWSKSVTPIFQMKKLWGEISSLPKVTEIVVVEMVFEASCLISKLKLFHSGMQLLPILLRLAEWIVTIVLFTKCHLVPHKR